MSTVHEPRLSIKFAPAKPAEKKPELAGYKDRPWYPRFWDGMSAGPWFSMIARNGFNISPRRWGMFAIISPISVINSALSGLQTLVHGRKIRGTELVDDPVFVIGHWRSGTTLLHELLVLDPQHTYPNTYDCFAPSHFLVSSRLFRPLLGVLMPKHRPMDNMAAGLDCPQEDEFALCNLGVPSPYLTIAFPNHAPQCQEYLDLEQAPPQGREQWKQGLGQLLKCLTVRQPKRIVLKSPPHTARIKALLEMFPRARFVHIVRNPQVLFPSTINLWKRLYRDEGLQVPTYEGLDEHVFDTFDRMYTAFDRDRPLVPPSQFCEVRYEDLVADPLEQMRRIYEELGLGDYQKVQPAFSAYFVGKKDYKTNRYQSSPEVQEEVRRRWGWYAERYGYEA
jgi:hypothetical protein